MGAMTPEEINVPDYFMPLKGWRAWEVKRNHELRATGVNVYWPPKEKMRALCASDSTGNQWVTQQGKEDHTTGRVPMAQCTCGIYAHQTLEQVIETVGPSLQMGRYVFGRVALWGKVIEHEHGWRGEFAYPIELLDGGLNVREETIQAIGKVYEVPVRLQTYEERFLLESVKRGEFTYPIPFAGAFSPGAPPPIIPSGAMGSNSRSSVLTSANKFWAQQQAMNQLFSQQQQQNLIQMQNALSNPTFFAQQLQGAQAHLRLQALKRKDEDEALVKTLAATEKLVTPEELKEIRSDSKKAEGVLHKVFTRLREKLKKKSWQWAEEPPDDFDIPDI